MRILFIEDDMKIVSFVVKGLEAAGLAVDHAADGLSGLHLAVSKPYDLAIIDLMLPKLDGLTIIEKIRDQKINLPILILSAKRSVDDRVKGLQLGSDDYLTKPFAFTELLARVQALIRRASGVTEPTALSVGDLRLDLLTRDVFRDEEKINLHSTDFALLEYLVRNKGRVVSKTMIIEHVWNYNFDPQTNIVEVRICRLRDKIDKGFSKKLIHTVRGMGYVLKEE